MKRTAFIISLLAVSMVILPIFVSADDIDMYNTAALKPNVLIIFDNSGSMDTDVPYDDSTEYCSGAGCYKETDTIYQRECLRWGWFGCRRWGDWVVYTGTFTDTNGDGIHDSDTNIRRGNRLNYDDGDYGTRLAVAKLAAKDIIEKSKDYVRFGVMVLNGQKDINSWGVTFPEYHNDTTVLSTAEGGALIEDREDVSGLISSIEGMVASGGTPLANRLINAAKYFRGDFGSYSSPLDATDWCRTNFVILLTDGKPEGEGNSLSANNNGDYDHIEDFLDDNPGSRDVDSDSNDPDPSSDYINGGSDYLDDVAYYLHHTDDSLDPSGTIEGNQNLTIYTIGFNVDHQLLQDTADNGGGTYHTTDNYQQLILALETIMASIIEKTQVFTAPVVPVQRTTSGNKMYVSLFTPKSHNNFWPGYLMKLHIGSNGHLYANDETTPATDPEDNLIEELWDPTQSPNPYWEAHAVLRGMNLDSRNIYTYLGNADLNDISNAFVTDNTLIDNTMLDNPTKSDNGDPSYPGSDGARRDLMRYVRGYDSYDEDADGLYNDKRANIFGDILHSRPVIVDYVIDDEHPENNERVVYVGTNDGMLHAIDDSNGSEKWAFIPPDLLPKLRDIVEASGHQYFVDGSPKAYIQDVDNDGNIEEGDGDQVIIVFGERRGGNCYNALDVTDPDDPQFLWRIDNSQDLHTNFGIPAADLVLTEMGQSWSEPEFGKVRGDDGAGGTEDKTVAIIGGGYWPDEQSQGNALYLIDITDCSVVESFTSSDHANMTYSIPSTVLAVDTTFDDYINRVYVGDLGGQMWRFGRQKVSAGDDSREDGDVSYWTPRRLFQGNSGTKIYYPPDLVLEQGYAYLYFGTGDRADPMDVPTPDPDINRFYAVKDWNTPVSAFATLTESDPDFFDLTTAVYTDTLREQILAGDGWYIIMENDGEKVLAPPVVFWGVVYFTTFTPVSDPCSYGGDGRVYAVSYLTAEERCSEVVGYGIPTEVIITINGSGEAHAYVAVGGKIVLLDDPDGPGGNFTVNSWRELF